VCWAILSLATCREPCNLDLNEDNIIARPLNITLQELRMAADRLKLKTDRLVDSSVDMVTYSKNVFVELKSMFSKIYIYILDVRYVWGMSNI